MVDKRSYSCFPAIIAKRAAIPLFLANPANALGESMEGDCASFRFRYRCATEIFRVLAIPGPHHQYIIGPGDLCVRQIRISNQSAERSSILLDIWGSGCVHVDRRNDIYTLAISEKNRWEPTKNGQLKRDIISTIVSSARCH